MSSTTLAASAPVRAAGAIRKLISDSALAVGAMLPPERTLSRTLGFSYVTIRAANHVLETQGVIRREHGRGTFVTSPAWDEAGAASRLRQKLIGYVYVSQGEEEDYALRQFGIMERALKAKGHAMVLGVLHEEDFGRTLPPSFDSLKLDALIIDGFLSHGYLHQLAQLGKPLVVAGNHSAHDRVPCVKIDFHELSRLLTRALFDSGMETVCMVTEPFRVDYTREMVAGYRQALLEMKQGPELITFLEGEGVASVTNSLRHVFARFGPKLGILGSPTVSVIEKLAAERVDFSQALLAVDVNDRITFPGLRQSAYALPVDRIAEEAAETLGRLLEGQSMGDKLIRSSLRSLNVNGRVDLDWQVCETDAATEPEHRRPHSVEVKPREAQT